jgi:HflK protein
VNAAVTGNPGFFTLIYLIFLETAPFIMIGLLLVGWMKILIPVGRIEQYLGQNNLKSAFYAALLGFPLPLCSCSVVPVTMGLREKKASRESLLSFMISAPETSLDTIIMSWGLLGPVLALVRPIVSFLSSLCAAVFSIADRTDRASGKAENLHKEPEGGVTDRNAFSDSGYHIVGLRGLWRSLKYSCGRLLSRARRPDRTGGEKESGDAVPFGLLVHESLHYGFTYMMDNFSLWFIIGILTSALIGALVPSGWFSGIPGGQVTEILFILAISVPLYVCSFESTPIAAMLILKGLSPGAALVFLLAGPATNLTTIVMVRKFFGRRFLTLFLGGVATMAVIAGFCLNAVLGAVGIETVRNFIVKPPAPLWHWISIVSAMVLLVLLGLSLARLDWKEYGKKTGYALARIGILESADSTGAAGGRYRVNLKRIGSWALALLIAGYFLSGIYQVPPGSAGFRFTLGSLSRDPIPPGLHYRLPFPFQRTDIRHVDEVRTIEIGYALTDEVVARWKERMYPGATSGWHSFFTNTNINQEQSTYLLGDENQIEAKFSVHFRIVDPVSFYYRIEQADSVISRAVESVIRKKLAVLKIDDILTVDRSGMILEVLADAQGLLDDWTCGVRLLAVYLVDLHPPVEAVSSFRDIASAMEDMQTSIHHAYASREAAIPGARGTAERVIEEARSYREEQMNGATGKAEYFRTLSHSFRLHPAGNSLRMYMEVMETVLPGKRKIIVPSELRSLGNMRVWDRFPNEILPGSSESQ